MELLIAAALLIIVAAIIGRGPEQPVGEWTDDEGLPTAGRKVIK